VLPRLIKVRVTRFRDCGYAGAVGVHRTRLVDAVAIADEDDLLAVGRP
jgi:hypothetical protein